MAACSLSLGVGVLGMALRFSWSFIVDVATDADKIVSVVEVVFAEWLGLRPGWHWLEPGRRTSRLPPSASPHTSLYIDLFDRLKPQWPCDTAHLMQVMRSDGTIRL